MPKLLLFLPCTSAMVDVLDGRWSIGSLIDTVLAVPIPENANSSEQPKFASEPILFFTFWWNDQPDNTQKYEQSVDIVSPVGKITTLVETIEFQTPEMYHRVLQRTPPIGIIQPGIYQAVLKFRVVGTEEWEERACYPLFFQPILLPTEIATSNPSE